MKNKTIKSSVNTFLFSLMALLIGYAPLQVKGQNGKEWRIYQLGNWDFTNETYFQEKNGVLEMGLVWKNGNTQAKIEGKAAQSPKAVFAKKLIEPRNNFTGDALNPVIVSESSKENVSYITNGSRVLKNTVGTIYDYKVVKSDTFNVYKIIEVGNYIAVLETGHNIRIYDSNFNYIKTISQFFGKGFQSMEESNGKLYVSISMFIGGKIYEVDIQSSNLVKIQQEEFSGNFTGVKLQNIDGELYATSDIGPGGQIWRMHYNSSDSSWNRVNAGTLVKDQKGRWVEESNYPNYNLIFDGKLGRHVDSFQAPFEYVDINEADGTKYWQTYPGVQPGIVKTFMRNDTLFGFGPNAVWYLADVNASAKSFSEVGLSMYPNPSTGNNIYISGLQKPEKYTISDLSGKIVTSGITMNEIDISRLNSGMFLLTLKTDKFLATEKIIRN